MCTVLTLFFKSSFVICYAVGVYSHELGMVTNLSTLQTIALFFTLDRERVNLVSLK